MNFNNILAVGLGGMLGSIVRYGSVVFIQRRISMPLPLPTLIVNIIGSFLLGMFVAYYLQPGKRDDFRLFLTTGFCGGFTTFSAFAVENLNLIEQKMPGVAFLYILLSVVLSIGAAMAGFALAKLFT
jgi:fluoride exporter